MSKSLFIDCWRTGEPAATDPLEQRTWAAVRVLVEGKCTTQFWDRKASGSSEAIYVPAFPLAEWIVENWWSLHFEPCRWDRPPVESERWTIEQRLWVRRHCLRAAESGLFLPYLHVYGNGRGVTISWSSDDAQAYPSMPGYFLYSGIARLDTGEVMTELGEFVSKVLGWCGDLRSERLENVRTQWTAITEADEEERVFCKSAGRMGLDPYDTASWNSETLELLTSGLGERAQDPIVEDLLESADERSAPRLWDWVRETESTLRLRAGAVERFRGSRIVRTAKDQGYLLARRVREEAGLGTDEPVRNLSEVSRRIGGFDLIFEDHNHVPGVNVQAAVGWRGSQEAVIAGPRPARLGTRRFLESRALYQALVGCRRGARLVTRTRSWDQQAARAFAAELLAPQEGLVSSSALDMGPEEREELERELADKYQVSTKVIELQMENRDSEV